MTSNMLMASSKQVNNAYNIVKTLQNRFVNKLNTISNNLGNSKEFQEVFWLRDNGLHGGGSRFEARDDSLFNSASVNVSQIHYDEDKTKALQSGTAISTIIHPQNPNVPSVHIHISLTQLKSGKSYWRLMADLNPSIINKQDKNEFSNSMKEVANIQFNEATLQGDKYFNIDVLNRTRGVSHFYLENYNTNNEKLDENFAFKFGEKVIDTYINIITNAFTKRTIISAKDKKSQLNYHTLYLFQVLTLDRGTTSGLLVHNQNDIGIMGSLPCLINKKLLQSWINKMTSPQDELLESLILCIKNDGIINQDVKIKLANAIRKHYIKYPNALSMKASGNTIPSTVSNHN